MILLSSLLFPALIAVVTFSLQQRSWKHQEIQRIQNADLSEAKETIVRLSVDLDKRLQAQRSFSEKSTSKLADDHDFGIYLDALSEWMGTFSSHKSRIHLSFGYDKVLEFEKSVQHALVKASQAAILGVRPGHQKLNARDQEKFESALQYLNFAQYIAYKFLRDLNQLAADERIGRTRHLNDIYSGELKLIHTSYLIRRLFSLSL